MKTLRKVYIALILFFLYAPILVMMLFSFNETQSTAVFSGFSLKWYAELFSKDEVGQALKNTLQTALRVPMRCLYPSSAERTLKKQK